MLPLNSAAAVVSDLSAAPNITPCCQLFDSTTNGTPEKCANTLSLNPLAAMAYQFPCAEQNYCNSMLN